MENNKIIMVLVLVVGLALGYIGGASRSFYSDRNDSMEHSGMDMMMEHKNGMDHEMDAMLSGMEGKTGAELERAFLAEMIVHHEGAVAMAQMLREGTTRPELLKMADDIITVQTQEIEMMRGWHQQWFAQ